MDSAVPVETMAGLSEPAQQLKGLMHHPAGDHNLWWHVDVMQSVCPL